MATPLNWPVAADGEFGGQVTAGPQPLAAGGAQSLLLALFSERTDLTLEEIREQLAVRGSGGGQLDLAGFTIGTASALKKSRTPRSRNASTWRAPRRSGQPSDSPGRNQSAASGQIEEGRLMHLKLHANVATSR
jgi:hypothetical protein